MDALDKRAFNQLLAKGVPFAEARSEAPSLAKDKFEQSYLRPLKDVKPENEPTYIVQLRGMLFHINSTDDQLNHSPPRHAQGRY